MTWEEVLSIRQGDIIVNTKTKCQFLIEEVILDSRDPPEFLNSKVGDKENISSTFGEWLLKPEWQKIRRD